MSPGRGHAPVTSCDVKIRFIKTRHPTSFLRCCVNRYYILSSSDMPLSERLWASSNKKPRRSSLYLWRAVILSVCLVSAFSYTQARGRPDRSSFRVQWNVTGTDERERQSARVSCLLAVMCHGAGDPWGTWPYTSQALIMPLGLLLSQRQWKLAIY